MVQFEDISVHSNSRQTSTQAKEWFTECVENHKTCKGLFSETTFVPARLVEISGSNERSLTIRLRKKGSLPSQVCYATLSHCWGSQMPFKLQRANFGACLQAIALARLSRVFQDAIKYTYRLKIACLWIDSLCMFCPLSSIPD
jgi:hypothetical protein